MIQPVFVQGMSPELHHTNLRGLVVEAAGLSLVEGLHLLMAGDLLD